MSGNLCMHRWVASTSCPGQYLAKQFKKIADEVNKKLTAKSYWPKTAYKGDLPKKNLKRGDSGDDVKALQNFLKWKYDGEVECKPTGNYGPKTEAAVKYFQKKYKKKYGLEPTGKFGPKSRKAAKAIVKAYAEKYPDPTKQEKMLAWAKKIAGEKYHYVTWQDSVYKTHTCPICSGRRYDDAYGWNCIGYSWASWRHGANLASTCNCCVFTDYHYNQLTKLSYADALKLAKARIGLNDIQLIRGNGIALSDLKPGDVIAYFTRGGNYVHTALYIGNGQIADCTSGRADTIKYGVNSYGNYVIRLAFRYTGK